MIAFVSLIATPITWAADCPLEMAFRFTERDRIQAVSVSPEMMAIFTRVRTDRVESPLETLAIIKGHLRANRVTFKDTFNERGQPMIEFDQTQSQGKQFNNALARFGKRFEVKRFVYDPHQPFDAAWDKGSGSLHVDIDSIYALKTSPVLAHELIHAKTFRDFNRGLREMEQGSVIGTPTNPVAVSGYQGKASLDEPRAYFETGIRVARSVKAENLAAIRASVQEQRETMAEFLADFELVMARFARCKPTSISEHDGGLTFEAVSPEGTSFSLNFLPSRTSQGFYVDLFDHTGGGAPKILSFPLQTTTPATVHAPLLEQAGEAFHQYVSRNIERMRVLQRIETLTQVAEAQASNPVEQQKTILAIRQIAGRRTTEEGSLNAQPVLR